MNISSEVLLGHARHSLDNASGDVHDLHHADWLIQESIAYSLLAIGTELKRFNDKEDLLREKMKEDSFEDRWPSMSVRKGNES